MDRKEARICPECGADSVVYNSRLREDGTIERRRRLREDGTIERRRRCQVCGAKFSTIEKFSRIVERRVNDYGD